MAEAISEGAYRQGNDALGKLTGLMLEAPRLVLASMIPGRQQIGAGKHLPGVRSVGLQGRRVGWRLVRVLEQFISDVCPEGLQLMGHVGSMIGRDGLVSAS